MIRVLPFLIALVLFACSFPAAAGTIDYQQDPAYQMLNTNDHHPMSDLLLLAEKGDVRAQFILGDLYAKGKGGLQKNKKMARHWFETSAKNGYFNSFIRLAALAKNDKNPVAAYQWYTLAIKHFSYGKAQKYAIAARQAVAADYKMTPAQIREATDEAEQWTKAAHQQAREKKSKEAPVKSDIKPKKTEQAAPAPEKTNKPKKQEPQKPPSKKENSYND